MRTLLVAIMSVLTMGTLTRGDSPPLPEVEYALRLEAGSCSKRAETVTVGIWVRSNATHGISCAFVDFTSNMPVVGITFGDDFATLASAEIDEFGVANLGGCSLAAGGAGQSPEWALVASVEVTAIRHARRFSAAIDMASHPSLGTSIYGEGNSDDVDYGKPVRCQRTSQPKRDRHDRRR